MPAVTAILLVAVAVLCTTVLQSTGDTASVASGSAPDRHAELAAERLPESPGADAERSALLAASVNGDESFEDGVVLGAVDGQPRAGLDFRVSAKGAVPETRQSRGRGELRLPLGSCRVECSTPHFEVLDQDLRVERGQRPIVWVADRRPMLLRVVDDARRPVESALVSRSKDPPAFGVTDRDGLCPLDHGHREVGITRLGYRPAVRFLPDSAPGATIEVALERSVMQPCTLRCRDLLGAPLPDVAIRADLCAPLLASAPVMFLGRTNQVGELIVGAEVGSASRLFFSGPVYPCEAKIDHRPSSPLEFTFKLPRAGVARLEVSPFEPGIGVKWTFRGRQDPESGFASLLHHADAVRSTETPGVFETTMPIRWPVPASCIDERGRVWKGIAELREPGASIRIELQANEPSRRITLISRGEDIDRVLVTSGGRQTASRFDARVVLTKTQAGVVFDAPVDDCSFQVFGIHGASCRVECGGGTADLSLVVEGLAEAKRATFLVVDADGKPVHDVVLEVTRRFDNHALLQAQDETFFELVHGRIRKTPVSWEGLASLPLPAGNYRVLALHLPWRRAVQPEIKPLASRPDQLVAVTGQTTAPIRVVIPRPRRLTVVLAAVGAAPPPEPWRLLCLSNKGSAAFRGDTVEVWTTSAAEQWQVLDANSRLLAAFDLPAGVDSIEQRVEVRG
jgi:hypothetical protein